MKEEHYILPHTWKKILWIFMGVGGAALGYTLFTDPTRFWSILLLNNFYFLSLALGGLFLVAILVVSNASWGTPIRRIPEAMTAYLPVAGLIFLLLYFGLPYLFHWAGPGEHDALLHHKAPYLNVPFFMVRVVLFFGIWIFFASTLISFSRAQDQDGSLRWTVKSIKYSSIFLVLFAFTFTLGSYDWMMSLEPHWFSTIFSVYTFAGLFLHSVSMVTMLVLILKGSRNLDNVNKNHLHDLGKLIFAFSTFWAYCWFCQYMLIWYANIPEETAYFIKRHEGPWFFLFIANMVLNWLVPFFLLMPRSFKRTPGMLWMVCLILLVAHYLDIYLMVYPSVPRVGTPLVGTLHKAQFGFVEIVSYLGFLGLFLIVTFRALKSAPLQPTRDPYLEEGLHLHQ